MIAIDTVSISGSSKSSFNGECIKCTFQLLKWVKYLQHCFEASDTDSSVRRNIDELLSSVTWTTWL